VLRRARRALRRYSFAAGSSASAEGGGGDTAAPRRTSGGPGGGRRGRAGHQEGLFRRKRNRGKVGESLGLPVAVLLVPGERRSQTRRPPPNRRKLPEGHPGGGEHSAGRAGGGGEMGRGVQATDAGPTRVPCRTGPSRLASWRNRFVEATISSGKLNAVECAHMDRVCCNPIGPGVPGSGAGSGAAEHGAASGPGRR